MSILEIAKIQVRRGQENQTGVPQLDSGEFGWAEDTEHLYIGKRIVGGAPDDNNTRILTENDLTNIFSLITGGTSAASTATYQYRESADYIHAVVSTIGKKLDNTVSLTDYGLIPSYTASDITLILQDAVEDLFYNNSWDDWRRGDARRALTIPAGNYYVSAETSLPPYTTLVGEGTGITNLILNNDSVNMFKTVDADGNNFETADMDDGVKRARGISLEKMTLMYQRNSTSTLALLQLDNVADTIVKDVHFKTQFVSTSTTTYGLTTYGKGISLRGTGGGIGSGDVNLCENIQITNCVFDGVSVGIEGTGTVVRPVITDNRFSNLYNGVKFYTIDANPGPSNGIIVHNRFENIVNEGIYVGLNPDRIRSNHLSENNFFIQVGNGTTLDDYTTTSTDCTAIINYQSEGNKSINDYFHRRTVANNTTASDTVFYYNPLVIGRTSINDESSYTATLYMTNVGLGTGQTKISKFYITGENQSVTVRYQMYAAALSRTGTLSLNLSTQGPASASDTYNFSNTLIPVADNVSTTDSAAITSSTQFAVDVTTYPEFLDIFGSSASYYVTTSSIATTGTLITNVVSGSGPTIYAFDTNANPDPDFDFTTISTIYLLKEDSTTNDIEVQISQPYNNYIRSC